MNDSYGLDFVPLLSATMRVADMHDWNHEPGASVTVFSEDRKQNSDGLWLELTARLLYYLHDEDINTNEGWVLLDPFISDMEGLFQIEQSDIQYIISYLATPTRITTCSINNGVRAPRSTKNTALIERPHGQNVNRARLTEIGRRTILLSQTAQKWLYAHHDTEKIMSAIELKDFSSIPQLCLSLSQAIRSFSHQIRRVMERPGVDEAINAFRADSEQYNETIKRVYEGVVTASKRLAEKDVQEAFQLWMDEHPDSNINPLFIHRSFDELMQSVEGLGRVFSNFIEAVLDSNRKVIGCIRFDKAAIQLACIPPKPQLEIAAFDSIGPWASSLCFPSPDDFIGCIKVRDQKKKVQKVLFNGSSRMAAPPPIYRFMEKYREEIIDRIKQGPISIGDAVNSGWADINGDIFTGQLVGVFSSPGWLNVPDAKISLSIKKDALRIPLPNGKTLIGDDLLITLEDTSDGI